MKQILLLSCGAVGLALCFAPQAQAQNTVGGTSTGSGVGSGDRNLIWNSLYGRIGGGFTNVIASGANFSTIGGGYSNAITTSNATFATVGGGAQNLATAGFATIAGGQRNRATNTNTFVGGGSDNIASGAYSTVGGGVGNQAAGLDSVIAGGRNNMALVFGAVVGGGIGNSASTNNSTVSGGFGNLASGALSVVGGGETNSASGRHAAIGGGAGNKAGGVGSSVPGGVENAAGGLSSVAAGGFQNTASGDYSMVAGGYQNTAAGGTSLAAGFRAQATNFYAFVWGGGSGDTTSVTDRSFTVRAANGARFLSTETNNAVGVVLANSATAWAALSDSNAKTDIEPVNAREVLHKVAALPVTSWHYKHDLRRRYIGPMAQDFHAAFGLGADDKTITTLDTDGVTLAAIKGLVEELKDRDAKIAELEQRLQRIDEHLSKLPPAQ